MKRTTKATGHTMKRTTSMQIRLSEEEAEKLKAAARAEGLPVGAWLRALGLKAAAGLLLLCLALPARALDRWTWQDTAWEAGVVASLAADWCQTRDIAWQNTHTHRDGRIYPYYNEGNPILGRRPSSGNVDLYFASVAVTHAAVAMVLPSKWRRAWQASAIGVELFVVGRNAQMSLRVRF